MKIGMYGGIDNGPVHDLSIDYIAIDNGLTFLNRQHISPLIAIGDFDSLEDQNLLINTNIIRYPSHKDETDTALAIKWAIDHGYDEIDLYGVIGDRMDHYMAVLALLEKYAYMSIIVYDRHNKIQVLTSGKYHLSAKEYTYFSVFAFNQSVITLKNCEYPLTDYLLKRTDSICVSNRCKDELILHTSDTVLLIQAS